MPPVFSSTTSPNIILGTLPGTRPTREPPNYFALLKPTSYNPAAGAS